MKYKRRSRLICKAETVHRHPMGMPGTLGRLGLNDQEIDDIVSFLQTLTDGYQP